jgi:chromosome segregation ATPase
MMQSATNLWRQKPDQLLERVMERAKTLLTAEKTALSQQVDSSRQAAMATVISTQSQTIEGLTAACAALHDAHAPLLAELRAAQVELAELHDAHAPLLAELCAAQVKLAELHDAHAPLLAELRAAQVELADCQATIRALEHHLRELHGSTSWRVTGPLRSLRQRLRPA